MQMCSLTDQEIKILPIKPASVTEKKPTEPEKPATAKQGEPVRPKDMKSFPGTISIKETTQQKLKEFDQKLDERHKNLHKGVEEGE